MKHIVREIKKYPYDEILKACRNIGYFWPRKTPRNVDILLEGMPKISLEHILMILKYEMNKSSLT